MSGGLQRTTRRGVIKRNYKISVVMIRHYSSRRFFHIGYKIRQCCHLQQKLNESFKIVKLT